MLKKKITAMLSAMMLMAAGCGSGSGGTEKQYSADCGKGDKVYADIVSLYPIYGIYEKSDKVQINKDYTELVAECFTAEGETLYLYIPIDTYQKEFDSTLDVSNSIVTSVMGNIDTVYYCPARRVHGVMVKSDEITEDLKDSTGELTVKYVSADAAGTPDTASAEAFSESLAGGDCAYIDVVSVTPMYTMSLTNMGDYSGFICSCEGADGNTYWMYFDAANYKNEIEPTVQTSDYVTGTMDGAVFEDAKRLYGGVVFSEAVSPGLADVAGQKMMKFISAE